MKALIVEDDSSVAKLISITLRLGALEPDVVITGTGSEGVRRVETESPDIVILDLGLPDMDGFEVLHRIRCFSDVPLIILTAEAPSIMDKIRGFEAGADDCLTKPFDPLDLAVRVKNALAHSRISSHRDQGSPLTVGPVIIDSSARQVLVHDTLLKLTTIEYKLLCYLARNAGRTLSHEQIMGAVWDESYKDSGVLKTVVWRLRRKLIDAGASPGIVTTVRGTGYKFAS